MVIFFSSYQRCCSCVSNELPDGVSVLHLHNAMKERRDDVSRIRYNDLPLIHFHDVLKYSQMKHHLMLSRWYFATMSKCCVSTKVHKNVVATSKRYLTMTPYYSIFITYQANPIWNTQWRLNITSPPCAWNKLPQHLVRQPTTVYLQFFQVILSWPPRFHLTLKSNTKFF